MRSVIFIFSVILTVWIAYQVETKPLKTAVATITGALPCGGSSGAAVECTVGDPNSNADCASRCKGLSPTEYTGGTCVENLDGSGSCQCTPQNGPPCNFLYGAIVAVVDATG